MLKFALLAVPMIPSILATLSSEEMTYALIAAKDTRTLEMTFKKFEKQQNRHCLSEALADVAKFPAHIPKVAVCLRVARNPFPKDKMRVDAYVDNTVFRISNNPDTKSFTNLITSFQPSDIKLFVAIRFWTLFSTDAVDILKSVMIKSPELITDDLPSWIASHSLDRNSKFYKPVREEAFKYLTSFATESVLEKALIYSQEKRALQGRFAY